MPQDHALYFDVKPKANHKRLMEDYKPREEESAKVLKSDVKSEDSPKKVFRAAETAAESASSSAAKAKNAAESAEGSIVATCKERISNLEAKREDIEKAQLEDSSQEGTFF